MARRTPPAEPGPLRRFVATHGVEFGEHPNFESLEKPGDYVVWAKFERDRSLDTPEGKIGFSFETNDPEVADRLAAVDDYGITEVEVEDDEADDSADDE